MGDNAPVSVCRCGPGAVRLGDAGVGGCHRLGSGLRGIGVHEEGAGQERVGTGIDGLDRVLAFDDLDWDTLREQNGDGGGRGGGH